MGEGGINALKINECLENEKLDNFFPVKENKVPLFFPQIFIRNYLLHLHKNRIISIPNVINQIFHFILSSFI